MPIYEFKCPRCGRRVEELCSMGEKGGPLVCPGCGHAGLSRVFSTFSTGGRNGEGKPTGGGCSGCGSHNCSTCH
ncbi:MAG TPA: zinc ribbon domain-containing protein [Bacillota bacterium]|jgi:putative FmdB family regulatory protein